MKNQWNYRTSLIGLPHYFLQSSRWDCPYIIMLGFMGCAFVYDTRKYSDMSKIDFNYFGYTLVSSHSKISQAKRRISRLMNKEKS